MASVTERLYHQYVMEANSGDDKGMISSHWKHWLKTIKIDPERIKLDDMAAVCGLGFGSYQYAGTRQRFFDRLTIRCISRKLEQRQEVRQMWKALRPGLRSVGMDLTLDVFRQLCSAHLISTHLQTEKIDPAVILIVGDGYGVLSVMMKHLYPKATIVLVDIGPVLLIQSLFCKNAFPKAHHLLPIDADRLADADFVYCPAGELEGIKRLKIDVAVNVASMQEMDPSVVDLYFEHLRNHLNPRNLFYCCNRLRKELPAGEVSEFLKYPWQGEDTHLVDEACPWHQYFISMFPTAKNFRWGNIPIPFVHLYDGTHHHRLTQMKVETIES